MKVTRQNVSEEYSTTVDWVNDFSKDLEKNADFLSNLKSIMKSRSEKFSTIDEKMADIKERVGFALVKDISDKSMEIKTSTTVKEAGGCGSSCGCKTCSSDNKEAIPTKVDEKLDRVVNLLKYIKNISENEPHLEPPAILNKCREKEDIDNMSINFSKLKKFIEEVTSGGGAVSVTLEYVPEDPISSSEALFGDTADYYQHGLVGTEQ